MAQDWDIKPRSDACQGCGVGFADLQTYYSALEFGGEGYLRADYCMECWQQLQASGRTAYSRWQGVFRKPQPRPEPLKKETAESLLRRFMAGNDATKINLIYILTIMLERKRILIEKAVQVTPEGKLIRIYEHRHTGETFMVTDPRLSFEQIESVQREVADLLASHRDENRPAMETESIPEGTPAPGVAEP